MSQSEPVAAGAWLCFLGIFGIITNKPMGDMLVAIFGERAMASSGVRRTRRGYYLMYLIPSCIAVAIGLALIVVGYVIGED